MEGRDTAAPDQIRPILARQPHAWLRCHVACCAIGSTMLSDQDQPNQKLNIRLTPGWPTKVFLLLQFQGWLLLAAQGTACGTMTSGTRLAD